MAFFQLNTFLYLEDLPANVQERVWFHALPEPRVFRLENKEAPHVCDGDDNVTINTQFTYLLKTIDRSPILLEICRESRRVALKYLQPAFRVFDGLPVYVNFQRDILVCTNTCLDFGNHMPGLLKDLAKVENLCTSAASHWVNEELVLERLAQFKSLRIMVTACIEEEDEEKLLPEGVPMYKDFIAEALETIEIMQEGKMFAGKAYEKPLVLFRENELIEQVKADAINWWDVIAEDEDDEEAGSDDEGNDDEGNSDEGNDDGGDEEAGSDDELKDDAFNWWDVIGEDEDDEETGSDDEGEDEEG